jgi:class 3 adenylate cyclase
VRDDLDPSFVLVPMPAEPVKGLTEPVMTYAVRRRSTVHEPAVG